MVQVMPKHLFILSPPFCGSTLLWKLLATSNNVSALPDEGQFLPEVKSLMRGNPLDPDKQIPWEQVESVWNGYWDMSKPILLEKSPPNIVRADQLEAHFSDAVFIAIMRNPYAFCEGHHRRNGKGVTLAAERWCQHAKSQLGNIQDREKILFFTYEQLTEDTPSIVKQIINFLPELEKINAEATFKLKSIKGRRTQSITNLNDAKIRHLSRREICAINKVLESHEEILDYFGYQVISPESAQVHTTINQKLAWAVSRTQRWMSRSLRQMAKSVGAQRRAHTGNKMTNAENSGDQS